MYQVQCECGKAHAVGAADAGASLRCPCGRTVEVPPLHQLRTAAGELGVSPVVQLQGMLIKNELPGTRMCACCGRETEHLVRVSVSCERIITKEQSTKGAALLGCLAFGALAGIAASVLSRAGNPPVQHGTEVSFVLPVRVCEACDSTLTNSASLREALSKTPAYAALLDRYPEALIHRIQ